jgi:hypothetical protein
MTIFGIRILLEKTYQADLIAAHCEEYEAHHRHRRELERKVEELDMQRGWWRMRFEKLQARPATVHIRPHPRFGLEIQVGADPEMLFLRENPFGGGR